MTETLLTTALEKSGITEAALTGILAFIAATGGTYGDFLVMKQNEGVRVKDKKSLVCRACEDGEYVRVSQVLDGDTFDVGDGKNGTSGEGLTVRLASVGAPETGMCYADEAKAALEKMLRGREVFMYKDLDAKDDFGRLVRYVRLDKSSRYEDNVLLNEWLIANGYAVYKKGDDVRHDKRLAEKQAQARARGKGLWGACSAFDRAKLGATGASTLEPTNKDCVIKGNVQDVSKEKVYFLPHCPNYAKTVISDGTEERYFCTEKEAVKAGFRKFSGCK